MDASQTHFIANTVVVSCFFKEKLYISIITVSYAIALFDGLRTGKQSTLNKNTRKKLEMFFDGNTIVWRQEKHDVVEKYLQDIYCPTSPATPIDEYSE